MKALRENIVIDIAQPEDVPGVLDLWSDLMNLTARFNKHYELLERARALQDSYLKGFFDSNTAVIFLARDGAETVGFTNVYITKPAPVFVQYVLGVIENLYVRPESRRMGIGRKLVERCHLYFSDLNVEEIYVNVIPANDVSEKFWATMGYATQKLTMARPGRQ